MRRAVRHIVILSLILAGPVTGGLGAGAGCGRWKLRNRILSRRSMRRLWQTRFSRAMEQTPLAGQYQGPFFKLNHDWPVADPAPIVDPPWQKAIGGGPISAQNAPAYVAALKKYVSANARQLLLDYAHWDAAKAHWYNEPWMGSARESIHGTYVRGSLRLRFFRARD